MANAIAIAKGHNRDGSTECSRLASHAAETQANTHRTSVNVHVTKDGTTNIIICRGGPDHPRGTELPVISHIRLNSEDTGETVITCDGLLRENERQRFREDEAALQEAEDAACDEPFERTAYTDLAEDR